MKRITIVECIMISIAFYMLGTYCEHRRVLKTIDVKISQDGQSGALPPVMRYGELISDSVATDTVLHGGQLYTPTVYYYTYRIDLNKLLNSHSGK